MHAASCVRPLRKEGRRSVCGLHAASQMQQVRTSGAASLVAGAVGMPMKRRFCSAMLSSRWMSPERRPSGSAPAGCRSKRSGLLCLAQGPMRQHARALGATDSCGVRRMHAHFGSTVLRRSRSLWKWVDGGLESGSGSRVCRGVAVRRQGGIAPFSARNLTLMSKYGCLENSEPISCWQYNETTL